MPKQVYDQYRSELTQGRPDTWYDPIKSYFGTLPEWDTTLPGTPEDAAYVTTELAKDMSPVVGPYRSGVRSTQEYNKMMGLLDEEDYIGAIEPGVWSLLESTDVALTTLGGPLLGGILSAPIDLGRVIKRGTKLKAGEGISANLAPGTMGQNGTKLLLHENPIPDEGPFRITYLTSFDEPYYHDNFPDLKSAEKQLLKVGSDFKKLSPDKVVPVSPDAIPKYIDDIPDLTPADLLGKKVFPIHADLTEGGAMYRGIDSAVLDEAEPLLGGKKFSNLESSKDSEVVWAVQGGEDKLIKKAANADYAVVVAMSHEAHKSNTTFSNSALKTMDAYVRDGRIGKRNLKRLDKLVRETKPKMKVSVKKAVAGFPGFGEKGYQKYLEKLSFEARSRIVEQLAKGQKFGAPNIPRIARKLEDPSTYGVNLGSPLIVIKLNKGPDNLVELGVHPGTTKHPSYKYGIKGEVVGKFPAPTAYESVFPDFANKKLAEGARFDSVIRASTMSDFTQTITSDVLKNIPFSPLKHIQSSRQAELALETAKGNWISTGITKTSGGVSPVDFENALKNSDASSTLTPYTAKEVTEGAKDGSFQVFQLGKAKMGSKGGEGGTSQIFFGIKDTDYNADYGFTHPDLGPNERAVVGVVNNEPGAKGVAAPGVMGKAIQEGATALDAYAVPSKKYPFGFLPEVYNDYGFVELDRIPFDEKYVRNPKFGGSETKYQDLLEYWRSTGWDESLGMPEMVIMKWKGDDAIRTDAIRLINENGSFKSGSQVEGIIEAAEEYSGKPTGPAHGGPPGTSPVNNPGGTGGSIRNSNAPHSGDQYRNVLSELSLLSPNQLQNLGLTPESLLY